ncbi:filamentation induced by cAMP protein Fic [Agrobacterium tumefaciens]|nr:filamentation induced by cAMP protein Fic [Agrobacterium tumefaciens]
MAEFRMETRALGIKACSSTLRSGALIGRVESLGFRTREATFLQVLTDDVVKSSAIEGEQLDEQQVRSSLARRLGIDIDGLVTPNRSVEGIVHITLDATINYSHPLTAERLFQWHAALFPTGRNEWGTSFVSVSGVTTQVAVWRLFLAHSDTRKSNMLHTGRPRRG